MPADRRKFLIVRLGSLGDLVHTLPAVAALRRALPDAEIDWLADAGYRPFFDLVPVVTRFIPFGGPTAGAWLDARRTLTARDYDVAADFQGLLKSAALARLSGARRVVGFDSRAMREPIARVFYSDQVTVGEGRHVIEKNLALAEALGAAPGAIEFPFRAAASPALDVLTAEGVGAFAIVNPGAAWPNKRWPAERFGRAARHLDERHGLTPIVLWGPGEAALADEVVAAAGGRARLAPPTGIADIVALARAARIVVSGDTGPLHLAMAVGTPAVALFGPTSPTRNGPWRPADVSVSRYEVCDCHYQRACRRLHGWCLGDVPADEVAAAIDRRLERA